MIEEIRDKLIKLSRLSNEQIALREDESIQLLPDGRMYYMEDGKPRVRSIADFVRSLDPWEDLSEIEQALDDYLMEYRQDLSGQDILAVHNQEIRRRLIRRMGYTKFVREVRGRVIHRDGSSQLVKIISPRGQEDYVFVRVVCPSTGDTYIIRVPPDMRTCRQAVAWTFGLTEDQYHPLIET
ncbi:MAG: hypothetical protein INQ03_06885 [Candidatus Heimdallarchaeota archaeon]|nr:hypothetical protein [Candidatus Heimdallarchaeota archaeon]